VYNDLASLVHADEGFPYKVPSFDNVNFRIGMEGERFSVTAYIENLFDAKYFTNVYEKAFVSGMALQPSYQTYGVRFTVRTH
jgi:iron complex outermembrane receptor protein